MTFGTPYGSDGGSPRSRYQQMDFGGFLDAGFEQVQRDLVQFQREEERRTPEPQQPEEGARALSWRDRCEALWYSLPNEQMLDESRRRIPSISYQFLTAFAHFRILAERLGYEGVSLNLLDEADDREERPRVFWRQVTEKTVCILKKTGMSNEEMRKRLQEISAEQFWEVEHSFLERVVAEEVMKYHEKMIDDVCQPPQLLQQEFLVRPRTTQDNTHRGGVQRAAKNRRALQTQQSAASRTTGFAINDVTPKRRRITNGLDTRNILTESGRSLRTRRRNTEQTTSREDRRFGRIVGGGVDGKRRGRRPRVQHHLT
ncbi:hypothetical protein GQX73_g1754 [Xylaria multiplex]|uniref:Uncharacterized protein n=1 Tax=Xylaria multiplex TaxID=323545 RepID=A0A7C8IVA7_9PEZI|nr:hypothetical protein GQX73_g1754 [Xylaria multiplex]